MGEHWLFRYGDDGELYGVLCHCLIGEDHYDDNEPDRMLADPDLVPLLVEQIAGITIRKDQDAVPLARAVDHADLVDIVHTVVHALERHEEET